MTLGSSTTRPLSLQPQKITPGNRILLVETNSSSNLISSRSPQPRVERYTLQEVPGTSPTCYYSSANLTYSNSNASTLSTASTASASQPTRYYTPPASPITDTPLQLSFTSPVNTLPEQKLPLSRSTTEKDERLPASWTTRMDQHNRTAPFSPRVVNHLSTPLGWIRPSLSPHAVLDPPDHHPSYFVFLGFGPAHVWQDIFELGPMSPDRNGTFECTFSWNIEPDRTPVLCTLATLNENIKDECPYLENLILNRVGVTSILVALPIHSTGSDIMTTLNKIDAIVKGLDPQHTWYEHLVLVFYPPGENRASLVRTTLPHLMHQISPMPCILLMGEHQQTHRRILYQQASMHQTDHGWWHGSTAWKDDLEDDDDDDDDDDGLGGILLPVTRVVGNKAPPVVKKKPLFTIDSPPAFLSTPPQEINTIAPGTELKHRFSKKWTEAPRRHQSRYG